MVVLDSLVFKVLDCNPMKPGEPLTACSATSSTAMMSTGGWCTGVVVPGVMVGTGVGRVLVLPRGTGPGPWFP